MKLFLALGLAFAGAIAAAPAHSAGAGVTTSGSIARTSAVGRPWGTNGAMSHPLGGFSSAGSRNFRGIAQPGASRVYPYGYAWYVPGYYFGDDSYYGATAPPPAPDAPPVSQQPVIVNQYFGAQEPLAAEHPGAEQVPQAIPDDPPLTAGDPIGTPQTYYLIAFRDHAVYSALAYWVEDKTLHYVTTQNTHNQASLDLIDMDLTKSLNQTRYVPFSIPGK